MLVCPHFGLVFVAKCNCRLFFWFGVFKEPCIDLEWSFQLNDSVKQANQNAVVLHGVFLRKDDVFKEIVGLVNKLNLVVKTMQYDVLH